MPKYIPVVVALILVAGPAAATLSPPPPIPQVAAEHRVGVAPEAPSIGPLAEPHG